MIFTESFVILFTLCTCFSKKQNLLKLRMFVKICFHVNKVLIESICRIINLALILNHTLLILIAIKTYIRESISTVHMYSALYSRVIGIAV